MAEDERAGEAQVGGEVASDGDPTAGAEPVTEQVEVTSGSDHGLVTRAPGATPGVVFGGTGAGFGDSFGDAIGDPATGEDEEWPSRAAKKGIRFRIPTIVLVGLLVAAGAFWGGAAVQRDDGSSSGSAALASLASRFGGLTGGAGARTGTGATSRTGAGGFGGFGGSTAAATGTVTVVSGTTLYLTSSTGAIVKVSLAPTTKVTRNATASLASLEPGDTVVVQGTKAKDGTVSATSIAATASGVTTAGGFGGFGGGTGATSGG